MSKLGLLYVLLLIPAFQANAQELQVGVGVFALAKNGVDIQVAYRQPHSHYQFGYKHVQWTDVFHDPFTGRALTETTQSLSGPLVNYLLHPESDGTYYFGISLLKWSRTEKALLITTPPGSGATTDFYFGGGYTKHLGQFGYYNLGMYLSPTAKLYTQTAVSSEDSSGGFDIQIQVGLAF